MLLALTSISNWQASAIALVYSCVYCHCAWLIGWSVGWLNSGAPTLMIRHIEDGFINPDVCTYCYFHCLYTSVSSILKMINSDLIIKCLDMIKQFLVN